MKQWIMMGLAALGAYTLFQYYQNQRSHPRAWAEAYGTVGPTGLAVDPLTSGVPGFNDMAVVNRPDQIAATQHNNMLATVPGGGMYIPAFGPDENRGGLEIF